MLGIFGRLFENSTISRSNPHGQSAKQAARWGKTRQYNFSLSGFGARLLPHFLVSYQNTNDVSVTWRRYSIQRHERAAPLFSPPSPPQNVNERGKNYPLTVKHDTLNNLARVGALLSFSERTHWYWSGRGAVEQWAVKAVDWWLDLRCGSRRGERMTHSVWCDVHPTTARQCGGTPAAQPDRSVCCTCESQTLSNC